MERRKILHFGLKNKDANLYMAEHLRSTMYFPPLSYWKRVNRKVGGLIRL